MDVICKGRSSGRTTCMRQLQPRVKNEGHALKSSEARPMNFWSVSHRALPRQMRNMREYAQINATLTCFVPLLCSFTTAVNSASLLGFFILKAYVSNCESSPLSSFPPSSVFAAFTTANVTPCSGTPPLRHAGQTHICTCPVPWLPDLAKQGHSR